MPLFLIITKLLLFNIITVLAYEYGYHASDEEFDRLMRDTRHTWTRDLIAIERHKKLSQQHSDSLSKPFNNKRVGEYFVPKFKYEREKYPYESTLNLKWPGSATKILRKPTQSTYNENFQNFQNYENGENYGNDENYENNDQATAASSTTAVKVSPPQKIASSLDFTMFSNEMGSSNLHNNQYEPTIVSTKPIRINSESVFNKKLLTPKMSTTLKPLIKVNSLQTDADSSERAWQNKYSVNNIYKNNSEAHFPIFFTNPATGIVYAINEIGHMNQNLTKFKQNNTIPIYISKQQYDNDIFMLKKQYENQCEIKLNKLNETHTALSSTMATIQRPQIIQLHKPGNYKPTGSKLHLGNNTTKPTPVTIQTAVTVNDQVNLPTPTKRTQKHKSKKKKKKRPGRKSQNTGPKIILGTQAPKTKISTTKQTFSTTKQKISSQLERPNLPASTTTTVFSSRPIAATKGYFMSKLQVQNQQDPQRNQRLKRSLPIVQLTMPRNLTNVAVINATKSAQVDTVALGILKTHKKALPTQLSNATNFVKEELKNINHNKTLPGFIKKHKAQNITVDRNERDKKAATTQRNLKAHQSTINTKNSKSSKKKKDNKDDNDFDFFELLDDDDDENESDDKNDSEIENDDYYYDDELKTTSTKKPQRHIIYINYKKHVAENIEDHTSNIESNNALKEPIIHENSSSAEDGADFGALEEIDEPMKAQHEPTPQFEVKLEDSFSSATKNTNGKKRIRRRPVASTSSASTEDYYDKDMSNKDDTDADDDDGGGGVGIGDFFSMIFYPVQVVMTRVFDTFAGGGGDADDVSVEAPTFPTYTQYSSANQKIDNYAEDNEEEPNSLTNWFGSLFGFNRKTKNIGSTTATPPLQLIEGTEAPGWFDFWFGGSKTTNSAETSASNEDYDDYDKWFSSWFNTKPKTKRRTVNTSTTTATFPQVPILTIVDPMRNPQNWIGILAHHILNSTTTTTHNPFIEALTRVTTTENPDIPRVISYNKYQIWRLKPQNEAQVKALDEYKKSDDGVKLQWLKGPSMKGLTDVLVPPKMIVDFQGTLQFESIAHEILIFDVGKAIAYEQNKEQFFLNTPRPMKYNEKHKYASLINMSWHKYHAYDDIVKYLESVRMRHPQIVELFHIGRSYEGRPLIVTKLEMKHAMDTTQGGTSSVNHKKLRHKQKSGHATAVFIEAGTHGLEWIGPATATWMINEVLRLMKSNKTSSEIDLVRNTVWYIMPVLNPDGYVYSHEYDRFWRKSRSRHISRPNGILDSAMTWLQQKKAVEKVCYGVDLDRNWHYQWGKRGSSKSPCNEHFAGPMPFSEPETKALSDFLMDNRKQIKLYLSMQAYGQIISYPTKIDLTFDSERTEDFMDVAMVGREGLRKKGSKSRYKIDSSNDLIEHRTGCSDAFAAFEVGTPFSYTLHLADNGVHGYLLPSSSIESTARDAFDIVTAMLDYI